ncbi:hypothetical protein [Corynebacterium sp. H78]|uniref:hypothetical protein n=1 Tax=Corynebacterium sp. H78 TaxID=3133417 RepID=UPI0030A4C8F8
MDIDDLDFEFPEGSFRKLLGFFMICIGILAFVVAAAALTASNVQGAIALGFIGAGLGLGGWLVASARWWTGVAVFLGCVVAGIVLSPLTSA